MYSIEKNIPIPEAAVGRDKIYPFDKMEIGDSFMVPFGDKGKKETRARVTSSCANHAKNSGRKYSLRTGESSVRVWRTA